MRTYTIKVTTEDDISFRDIERVLNTLDAQTEMIEIEVKIESEEWMEFVNDEDIFKLSKMIAEQELNEENKEQVEREE